MSTATAATPSSAAAVTPVDSVLYKVQKKIDTLEAKNAKLLEDNQRLKEALAQQRTRSSRIRTIPKKQQQPSDATGGTA
jgi:hypothetical protein